MWKQNGLHKTYECRNDGRRVLTREVEDYIETPFPYKVLAIVIATLVAVVYMMESFGM